MAEKVEGVLAFHLSDRVISTRVLVQGDLRSIATLLDDVEDKRTLTTRAVTITRLDVFSEPGGSDAQ